jgi:formate C-acetyltransferase
VERNPQTSSARAAAEAAPPAPKVSARVLALHAEVLASRPTLCAERALEWTRYCRSEAGRAAGAAERTAGALAHVLRSKRKQIWPRELLVGNFTSHRVGAGIYPELHGVPMLEELRSLAGRSVNPFAVSSGDRRRLLREVIPYWATRAMPLRAFPLPKQLAFLASQLAPVDYLINESGGISHFVPDYQSLLARGIGDLREDAAQRLAASSAERATFYRAVITVCDGLEAFARGYRDEAERLARGEADPARKRELLDIAEACSRVPMQPARTFREALQSVLFVQIALNLESLDNSVSPGRLDRLLGPFYERDLAAGVLDATSALELLGCFAVKLCELLPMFSARATRFHGGLFNGQVVVVGGVDPEGVDSTNPVSWLLLELMDQLRTRQPNYHARLHPGSPPAFRRRIAMALAGGAVSPAVYNDALIVPLLRSRGVSEADSRSYANVGCVEPVVAGKCFYSTDAALLNVPLCLELALNRGRRFGRLRRLGIATVPAASFRSMQDVLVAFRAQLQFAVGRLLADLRGIELANARLHPTALTSALLDGCLEHGVDATAGGARYNGSGVQGVGVIEVGDSLAAIDHVVFRERLATLTDVVRACREDFVGHDALREQLAKAPKYGNDDPRADEWSAVAMREFAACLDGKRNSRGGDYVAGFYSVTSHIAFGEEVGALPSGRGRAQPYGSGLSPGNGRDRAGPTAALRSAASLPLDVAKNGVNFNLQLPPWLGGGGSGAPIVQALIDGGFAAGCMQMQVNVLDVSVLRDALEHPGRYPGLLVRVSGYSAYFDDLSPAMKRELIERFGGRGRY